MADKKANQPVIHDEDDEFEEFRIDNWDSREEDMKNPKLWDQSWDNDSLNDPLGQQLQAQLPQALQAHQQQQQQQQQQ